VTSEKLDYTVEVGKDIANRRPQRSKTRVSKMLASSVIKFASSIVALTRQIQRLAWWRRRKNNDTRRDWTLSTEYHTTKLPNAKH